MSDYKPYESKVDCKIHINECWGETLNLTVYEVEDWLDAIEFVFHDTRLNSQQKLQRIVDLITKE